MISKTTAVCSWMCTVLRCLLCLLVLCSCQRQVIQHLVYEEDEEIPDWLYEEEADPPQQEIKEPTEPAFISYEVTEEFQRQLEALTQSYRSAPYMEAYTLQLFSDADREEVMRMSDLFREEPLVRRGELKVRVIYEQPRYKLQAGLFYDYLAAHEMLVCFQDQYPLAMIVFKEVPIPAEKDNPTE